MTAWDTPKDAITDVLSKLGEDAEVVEIRAWYERGRVYCTTLIKYPNSIEAKHDPGHPPKRCKARCDC
jgi:hypothetical protein